MSRRRWIGMMVVGVLVAGGTLAAHDGHDHTVMGTVTKVGKDLVEVKTAKGEVETIATTDKTVVTKGKMMPAKLADLAVGQRVVVDVGDGKAPLTAKGIRLGMMDMGKMAERKKAAGAAADEHGDHGDEAGKAGEHDHEAAEPAKPAKKGCCEK